MGELLRELVRADAAARAILADPTSYTAGVVPDGRDDATPPAYAGAVECGGKLEMEFGDEYRQRGSAVLGEGQQAQRPVLERD
jgi:hypothetical protein